MSLGDSVKAEWAVDQALALTPEPGFRFLATKSMVLWDDLSRREESMAWARRAGPSAETLVASAALHLWHLEETVETCQSILQDTHVCRHWRVLV
jgi:hypothetical protein